MKLVRLLVLWIASIFLLLWGIYLITGQFGWKEDLRSAIESETPDSVVDTLRTRRPPMEAAFGIAWDILNDPGAASQAKTNAASFFTAVVYDYWGVCAIYGASQHEVRKTFADFLERRKPGATDAELRWLNRYADQMKAAGEGKLHGD